MRKAASHLAFFYGEAPRIAIGRTILSSPELVLLDESLTGIDSAVKM